MLRVITERQGDNCRLDLHGTLGGEWVGVLDEHWRSVMNASPPAKVTLVLSNVDFIDADGEALLQRMAEHGVEFVSAGCMNRYVIDHIEAGRATRPGRTKMKRAVRLIAAIALAAASLLTLSIGSRVDGAQPMLPSGLASFLAAEAQATPAERDALLAGNPLVKLLDADAATEIAVLGAIWVNARPEAYVEQVKHIEQFERGGAFHVTKRISDPPIADDFAGLTISDQDFEDLKDCTLGNCSLKLDADGLKTLRAEVDWRKPTAKADATALFRRLALQYVAGYKAGGNARLGVHRDKERPTFVGNEFRSMIDRLPRLNAALPDLTRYLLEYPNATLAHASDFLYWQETQFGLKPTVRINHLVIQQRPEQTVVASKMLYASHYFWTALELRVLLPDAARGPGFWFVTVNRSRSDGLSGFTGRVIRSRVRSEIEDGTRAALMATKTKLESKARDFISSSPVAPAPAVTPRTR